MEQRNVSLKDVKNVLERGKCIRTKQNAFNLQHGRTTVVVSRVDRAVITTWRTEDVTPKWRGSKRTKLGRPKCGFSPEFNRGISSR